MLHHLTVITQEEIQSSFGGLPNNIGDGRVCIQNKIRFGFLKSSYTDEIKKA
jgi:hypothetical protein